MGALCWRQNIVENKEGADACDNFAVHLDPRFSVLSSKLLFSNFPCFLRTLYFFDDISHSLAPHFSALSSFSFIFSFSLTVCLFWGSPLLSSPHSFFSALSITRDISQFRHYFAPSLLGFFQSFFSASLTFACYFVDPASLHSPILPFHLGPKAGAGSHKNSAAITESGEGFLWISRNFTPFFVKLITKPR